MLIEVKFYHVTNECNLKKIISILLLTNIWQMCYIINNTPAMPMFLSLKYAQIGWFFVF